HDEGVALDVAGADRLVGNTHDVAQIHQIVFQWASAVDVAAANADLRRQGVVVLQGQSGLVPPSVANLVAIDRLPGARAIAVGLLALVAVGHGLSVSSRRRRGETSILRAIGVVRSTRALVGVAQVAVVALVAIAVGSVVGDVLGRAAWTLLANRAHVIVRPV